MIRAIFLVKFLHSTTLQLEINWSIQEIVGFSINVNTDIPDLQISKWLRLFIWSDRVQVLTMAKGYPKWRDPSASTL